MYNASDVHLHWEPQSPVTIDRKFLHPLFSPTSPNIALNLDPDEQLTEFALIHSFYNETIINADLKNLRHGAFSKLGLPKVSIKMFNGSNLSAGFYSTVSFSIVLNRQSGFYLLDYFLPSMMIVAISWVSFWIQGDQGAPRVMLGTATMLTFITLASNQDKSLPKVSYVKATEIWFMGCTTFIFASLLEFALVNTFWRQKRYMKLKEVTAKSILKKAIQKGFEKKQFGISPRMHRAHSLECVEEDNEVKVPDQNFKDVRSSLKTNLEKKSKNLVSYFRFFFRTSEF